MDKRIELTAQIAAIAMLVIGCFLVLRPFLAATLFSAAVCLSTWPLYTWLRAKLRYRHTLAASLMALILVAVGLVPFTALVTKIVDEAPQAVESLKAFFAAGPPQPPAWLAGLPIVGEDLVARWQGIAASTDELLALAQRFIEPARTFLLAVGSVLGQGILQLTLAAFIGFFLYRDGESVVEVIRGAAVRLMGGLADPVLSTIGNTVVGVMYGIIGTALAQGAVALIGFWIAGVPSALLLGAATFLLSPVPIGPPLVWGGAAIWLFSRDEIGWAIFMVIWGIAAVSSIDNVVKPLLISRGAAMPFVLVLLGVFGGAIAFGFIGVFLGPIFLAVGYSLMRQWTGREPRAAKEAISPDPLPAATEEDLAP